MQDLRYTYDPAGNITRIEDAALKTIIHDGQQVAPVCAYTYDAIYRLIEATGREHIGQTAHDFSPQNRRDFDFAGLAHFIAHPNDLQALRTYAERYEYDAVGNFDFVRHGANGGSWTRNYEYAAASLVEPTKQSNRLTKTTVGNNANHVETYSYVDDQGRDVHGCITAINSMNMAWDFRDQLRQVNLGGGGTAYYVYDAAGQRLRKVIERNGATVEERIYLGAYEVYRKRQGGALQLERQTLHIMDDKQRIALVETKTHDTSQPPIPDPQPLIRYQFANHLGSASLELDDGRALISYEEYHPYGTTAFQAGRSAVEVRLKRYRFTGKERDEETGFSYHSARYYLPWLGRWTAVDPSGVSDGVNVYAYVGGNPISKVDDTGNRGLIYHMREEQRKAAGPAAQVGAGAPSSTTDNLQKQRTDLEQKFGVKIEKATQEWSQSDSEDLTFALQKLSTAESDAIKGYKFMRYAFDAHRTEAGRQHPNTRTISIYSSHTEEVVKSHAARGVKVDVDKLRSGKPSRYFA